MNYASLFGTVITLFLLIATGFLCRKAGIMDEKSTEKMSVVIVKVGQPMLLISAMIKQNYSPANIRMGLIVLALSFGIHAVSALLAFGFSRPFKDADEKKIAEYAFIFTNCGFVGFPVLESILGDEGLFCGAFYVMGFNVFVWTWGIYILSRGRGDIKLTPLKILLNYGTVPSIIGLILYVLPVEMPGFVLQYSSYLSGICTPLSLLVTGAVIASDSVKKLFLRPSNYYVSAIKLIVIPAVVCFVLKLLGFDDFFVIFGTVMAAMPSASVVSTFTEMYSIKPLYASGLVGMTGILCVATLPAVVKLTEWVVSL